MFPIDNFLSDFVVSTIDYVNKVFKENFSFIQVKDVFSVVFIFEQFIFSTFIYGVYIQCHGLNERCARARARVYTGRIVKFST